MGVEGDACNTHGRERSSRAPDGLVHGDNIAKRWDFDPAEVAKVVHVGTMDQHQVGWLRAPEQGKCCCRSRVEQGTLAFDKHDVIAFGARGDLLLDSTRCEVHSDSVKGDSIPFEHDSRLACCHEFRSDAEISSSAMEGDRCRHFADRHVGSDKQDPFAWKQAGGSHPRNQTVWFLSDVPDPFTGLKVRCKLRMMSEVGV